MEKQGLPKNRFESRGISKTSKFVLVRVRTAKLFWDKMQLDASSKPFVPASQRNDSLPSSLAIFLSENGFPKDTTVEAKLLLQDYVVGAIKGQNGVNIRSLEAATGTNLSVSQRVQQRYSRGERVLKLSGSWHSVASAVSAIGATVEDYTCTRKGRKGTKKHLHFKLIVASTHVGAIIGKRGKSIKAIKRVSGAEIQVTPDSGLEAIFHVYGDVESITQAVVLILRISFTNSTKYSTPETCSDGSVIVNGGNKDSWGAEGFGYGFVYPPSCHINSDSFYQFQGQLQANMVGKVIGKYGKRLQHLESTSGAKLIFSGEEVNGLRHFKLFGTPEACFIAQNLLRELLVI